MFINTTNKGATTAALAVFLFLVGLSSFSSAFAPVVVVVVTSRRSSAIIQRQPPPPPPPPPPRPSSVTLVQMMSSSTATTEKLSRPEIEVVVQPDEEFLQQKGVFQWGTWGCDVSKFPWSYDSSESCYLLAGQVTVTPTDGRNPVTFGKGDFVTFPAGMSCTWDVTEAVQKHFMFF